MSDREQRILDELEGEFRPGPVSVVRRPWSAAGTVRSLVAGGVAGVVGLILLIVGVVVAGGIGVALAVPAYVLVVVGVRAVVACVSVRRAARQPVPVG